MAGDAARAESLAQDLNTRYRLDTQMQALWLPMIQAQLALNKKNPGSVLTALQAASSIELEKSVSSPTFPASIRRTFVARHI